jgi:transcriptional regulator with XRE-family HTH domain
MYDPIESANRIKIIAKSKNITIKNMLDECGLNKNVISTMQARNSMPKADNLGRIADYLDCSVDYLLGRTDNPEINR